MKPNILRLIYRLNMILKDYIFRDKKSLSGNKIEKNRVNLEYFYSGKFDNFGDTLTPMIVKWILKQKNISLNDQTNKTYRLYAVGSICDTGYSNSVVWGSGFHVIRNLHINTLLRGIRKVDIRAVRGPITRNFYRQIGYDCPEVYGDPAILMPLIYNNENIKKEHDVSVIVHYDNDFELMNDERYKHLNFINIRTTDYKYFIDEILKSKKVVSSSLHGIILSESYGVPCSFFVSGRGVEDSLIKYYDWYFSTNRADVIYHNSLESALVSQSMNLPLNFKKMQDDLIEAFPYDLWDN